MVCGGGAFSSIVAGSGDRCSNLPKEYQCEYLSRKGVRCAPRDQRSHSKVLRRQPLTRQALESVEALLVPPSSTSDTLDGTTPCCRALRRASRKPDVQSLS